MAGLEGLEAKNLKKTVLVFGFDDILVPGRVLSAIDSKKIIQILENLQKLSEKTGLVKVFVVSGYTKEIMDQKLSESGLSKFFPESHILYVNQEYLDSKEPMDREIYDQQKQKDPLFKDEYFKQKMLDKLSIDLNVPKSSMVFIGHDVWFDAFYSQRFSKVDFVLVKDALANQNQKFERIIKGLNYIHMDWDEIRKILLGKLPEAELDQLKNFIQFQLQAKLVSPQTMGRLIEARQEQLKKRADTAGEQPVPSP